MAAPIDIFLNRADGTDVILAGLQSPLEGFLNTIAPNVFDLGIQTDISVVEVRLDDGAGTRNDIGLFTEWMSEWLAIYKNPAKQTRANQLRQFMIDQANHIKNYPWDDLTALEATNNPTQQGDGSVSGNYSHFPNIFFPAILLTDNDSDRQDFITAARGKYDTATEFFNNLPTPPTDPNVNYWIDLQERGWAWALRELAQLAFLEREGIITDSDLGNTQYRTALTNNYNHLLAQILRNEVKGTYCFGTEIWRDMDGRNDRASIQWRISHWQQAYVGQVIAYIIKLGFLEWINIANFNVQHWTTKLQEWDWWAFDGDYSYQSNTVLVYDALPPQDQDTFNWWQNTPFSDQVTDGDNSNTRSNVLLNFDSPNGWPSNLIVDNLISGERFTFNNRLDSQLSTLGMYRKLGVAFAGNVETDAIAQRSARISRGGSSDGQYYRFSFEWRD